MAAVEFGTVAWFDSRRGFGFIRVDGRDTDVFAHHRNIAFGKPGYRNLERDARVQFEVVERQGKLIALNILPTVASENGGNSGKE